MHEKKWCVGRGRLSAEVMQCLQPAVNDLFLLAFATRRDGPANAQIKTAAELLGGAGEPQAKAVLGSLRKVILKW